MALSSRREFLERFVLFSLGLPLLASATNSAFHSSRTPSAKRQAFNGKVLIIGAGAAGLTAAYLLKNRGVDFEILEASSVYGGRLKKLEGFVDFPIDLGAEWIHTHPRVLAQILQDPSETLPVEIIEYSPQSIGSWHKGRLKKHNYLRSFYSEWKFKNTTWFDFFETYMAKPMAEKIQLNSPVVQIDYSDQRVLVTTADGAERVADKVLVTLPIKVLQNGMPAFHPPWPAEKSDALHSVFMGDGLKVFIEFSQRFYPDILTLGNIFSAARDEEIYLYDAAFGKESKRNVLGLFAINEQAAVYTQLQDDQAIVTKLLGLLDSMFNGVASRSYLRHVVQNWSAEPYIQGAYSYSFEGKQRTVVDLLRKPLEDKVYFAGEALSLDNQAMVHGACESALLALEQMGLVEQR